MTTNVDVEEELRSALARAADRVSPPDPDLCGVRGIVHRRRRRRFVGLVGVVIVFALGLGGIVVVRDHDGANRVEAGRRGVQLPKGSVTIGPWTSVPTRAAGLPRVMPKVLTSATGALLAGGHSHENAGIWRSRDGLHWQKTSSPSMRGRLFALGSSGDVALAVGVSSLTPRGSNFVWRSDDDGRTWRALARGPKIFATSTGTLPPLVRGLTRSNGWWVAWGEVTNTNHGALWISREGTEWRQVLNEQSPGGAFSVVDGPGNTLIALTSSLRWSTSDPTDWGTPQQIALPPSTLLLAGSVGAGADVALARLAGIRSIDLGDSTVPLGFQTVLLRSSDHGLTWAIDPNFASQFPRNEAHRVLDTGKFVAVAGQTIVNAEETGTGGWHIDNEGGAWVTVNGSDWSSFPAELPRGGDMSPSATIDNRILFVSGNDWYYIFDTRTLR